LILQKSKKKSIFSNYNLNISFSLQTRSIKEMNEFLGKSEKYVVPVFKAASFQIENRNSPQAVSQDSCSMRKGRERRNTTR
jgi:hypothetical protein